MSWDSYIDNLIAQSKDSSGVVHVGHASIIGLDGGAAWTTNAHPNALKFQGTEGADVARCFKTGDFTAFMSSGIMIEGEKYQFLRRDDTVVLGKKKGKGSITLQKSKTAIVAGHCPEGCQQGLCNKAVGFIAEYLETLNM